MASEVSLEAARPVLQLFYRMLSGRSATLAAHRDEADPAQYPDTRSTLRLPARAERSWYRVALAHRAMHHDARTFALSSPRAKDVAGLIALFADRRLALHCFTLLEDMRVDALAARRYPGLARAFDDARQAELDSRPALEGLAPRSSLLEVLARASLLSRERARIPAPLAPAARDLVTLASIPTRPDASVGDVAEAAVRAYALIAGVPQLLDARRHEEVDLAVTGVMPDPAISLPEAQRSSIEGDEILEVTLAPIRYRDDLSALVAGREPPSPLDQEAIFRVRGTLGDATEADAPPGLTTPSDAGDDAMPRGPIPHDHHEYGDADAGAHEHGALAPDAPRSYVYPEWDHRAMRYRERWCRVREVRAEGAVSTRVYRETLRTHGAAIEKIRRQFEQVAPESLRRVRGVRDGDELDLDACIEALADLRAGVLPSDNVYAAREVAQRDLAVIFLVDLSASTAERIDEGSTHRRILDVERESVVLLIEALERLGDVYGIYGFSGTGREDVRFVVIKDLRERVSDNVVARLDALRPIHTTRMAPAIRHATRRLGEESCSTKLLVVVSDGRPFDIDYGQEYGDGAEIDYATNDTRRALDEARGAGVRPFLLTVDRDGADYLRDICGGIDYEVLSRTSDLPTHLLGLYRRLRASDHRAVETGLT